MCLSTYRTIYRDGEGNITEKKSRFLAFARHISAEEEAAQIITALRKEHRDARHVCYAYVLHGDTPKKKYSDDGEPQGTAGRPMLECLERAGLEDALVAVVRYFGGVLLGTGGLQRAYSDSARLAISNAVQIEKIPAHTVCIPVDYTYSGKVAQILAASGVKNSGPEYTDVVTYRAAVTGEQFTSLKTAIADLTGGSVLIEKGDPCYFADADGKVIIFES